MLLRWCFTKRHYIKNLATFTFTFIFGSFFAGFVILTKIYLFSSQVTFICIVIELRSCIVIRQNNGVSMEDEISINISSYYLWKVDSLWICVEFCHNHFHRIFDVVFVSSTKTSDISWLSSSRRKAIYFWSFSSSLFLMINH